MKVNGNVVIRAENISKLYRLGMIGSSTVVDDLSHIWNRIRGKSETLETNSKFNNKEDLWALKDINFEVKQGEVLGIIGRNGAGKSTLLKIISQITQPTSGEIRINGKVASLLEVGTGFHPELSGRDNIFLNGSILGMRKNEIKNKFDEIVDFSGVEKFIDTPVKRYSSGMYVRLAFAVAAHLEPEILIVDEVLAVGDAEFQNKCIGKMKDVSGQGRTVLFVSHNMGAVKSLCSKGLLLENGKIKYSNDDVNEVIKRYFKKKNDQEGQFTSGRYSNWEKVVIKEVTIRNQHDQITESFHIGDDLIIDLKFIAEEEVTSPHIGIAITWQSGAVSGADTMYDGTRTSTFKKGENILRLTFQKLPLLPNEYFLGIAMRTADGKTPLMESKTIGRFGIITRMKELGMDGTLAEEIAEQAVSPFIPYKWDFGDGNVQEFNILSKVKR